MAYAHHIRRGLCLAALVLTALALPSAGLAQTAGSSGAPLDFALPGALPFDIDPWDEAPQASLDDQLPCLCAKALGATSCKDDEGFHLMGQQGSVYVFSAFYASEDQVFYCVAKEDRLVLSAEPWGRKRLAADLETDAEKGCLKATMGLTLCDTKATVECCAPKRPVAGGFMESAPEAPAAPVPADGLKALASRP